MSHTINAKHYEYDAWVAKATKCRIFMAGEDEVNAAGTMFLPKLAGQTNKEYKAMQNRALFFAGSKRTRSALSGAIHRKPPTVEMPAGYEDLLKDITLQETPFTLFAKQVTDEVLTSGKSVICVDYDEYSDRVYARLYNGEALINYRYTNYYGKQVLTLIVLSEVREVEADGDAFTIELKQCYRVKLLDNGILKEQLWQADDKGKTFTLIEEHIPTRNGQPLNFIPVINVNTNSLDCNYQESLLNDVVSVNIKHRQVESDLAHVLHYSSLATLVVEGITGDQLEDRDSIRLGSTEALMLPPGVSCKILEPTGASAASLRLHLEDLERLMSVLGARLLSPNATNAQTAVAELVKSASELTSLASLAQTLDDGLTKVLNLMLWWSGNEAETKVSLNKDFLSSKLTPSALTSLVDAYLKGGLSSEVFLYQLEQGEYLPPNVDRDAELKRLNERPIDNEGMNMRSERNQGVDTTLAQRANNNV